MMTEEIHYSREVMQQIPIGNLFPMSGNSAVMSSNLLFRNCSQVSDENTVTGNFLARCSISVSNRSLSNSLIHHGHLAPSALADRTHGGGL